MLTLQSDFDEWESYLEVQSWGYPHGRAVEHYYETMPDLPVHVYHGEDRYEAPWADLPGTPAYYYRRLFWSNLLSGGSGTYGSKYKALIPYDETGSTPYYYTDGNHEDTTQLTGLDETIHIREFFEQYSVDLADYEPDDALAELKDDVSPEGDAGPSKVQAAHNGGDAFLFYHPNAADGEMSSDTIIDNGEQVQERVESRWLASLHQSRTPGLRADLRAGAGRTYDVIWFHPTTGESHRDGTIEGGSWVTLVAPSAFSGDDAVLLLQATP